MRTSDLMPEAAPAGIEPAEHQLERHQLRRVFEQAAPDFDTHAVLYQEINSRMLERLQWIKLAPARILDAGCGTGAAIGGLLARYPKARLIALDQAPAMLARARRRGTWRRRPQAVCADLVQLPLADASIDLVYANLALQWVTDWAAAFAELRRTIPAHGLLMFSVFGPDTFAELRRSWARVDDAVHVASFMDMHDIGDALVQAGFAEPVMDMEMLTLTYADMPRLMTDLRGMGLRNALVGRRRSLTGKDRLSQLEAVYAERYRQADGRLPLSFEIVYGHAWVPNAPPPGRSNPGGYPSIPIVPLSSTGY